MYPTNPMTNYAPQPIRPPVSSFQKFGIGCLAGCGVLIVLLVLLGVAAFYSGNKSIGRADTVARKFLQDVQENKSDQAYSLTTSEFRQSASLETWQKFMKKWRDYAGDAQGVTRKGQWWQAGTNGTIVRLIYSIQGSKHEEQVTLLLRSTGGEFQILHCDVQPFPL